MNHPQDRRYAPTHEWALPVEANHIRVGISDYAQQALGDVVHASLPTIGQQLQAGDACCVLESVKAASDVHAPVSGEVVAINPALADNPELINDDVYDQGWLFIIAASNPGDTDALMSAQAYESTLE